MEDIDILLITYNSEKWILDCIDSILNNQYDTKKLFLTFVDNNSTDNSVAIIESYRFKGRFGGFKCIRLSENKGFGAANNIGAIHTYNDFILFLNIDTRLHETALKELQNAVLCSDGGVGLWEMRQFPYEHPKLYNPITMETSWCSAAASLVRREVFEKCGGFDESIFMYAEDVDLSWRIRELNYELKYVPSSIVYHYTYDAPHTVKGTQLIYSLINNLKLRYKFGTLYDLIKGYIYILIAFIIKKQLKNKLFIKSLASSFGWSVNKHSKSLKKFYRFDYEIMREGAFYYNELPKEVPLVSVLIRTIGRPQLREALQTIKNQTYKHIEVVIVEDGEELSQSFIREEFSDLNVKYIATGQRCGRGRAANMAMSEANGEYFVFLDDDDLFFADHIEVLVTELLKNNSYQIAYSLAYEALVDINEAGYEIKKYQLVYNEEFNRYVLARLNYLPIQCVMFSRKVYEELGGVDESLPYLEDWDLWLRYSSKCSFIMVKKVTSIYKVPYKSSEHLRRKKILRDAEKLLRKKHAELEMSLDDQEVRCGMERMKYINSVSRKIKNKSVAQILMQILCNIKWCRGSIHVRK